MKKTILSTIILITFSFSIFSCSSSDDSEDTPSDITPSVTYEKLKAYNKTTAYYYYSADGTKNGISRIYLDTINGRITQNTSDRTTNKGETKEEFIIESSVFYKNYNKTNIDYVLYKINYMKTYEVISNIERDKPFIIVLSHDNSDKFVFYRIYGDSKELFLNNFQTTEYYKILK